MAPGELEKHATNEDLLGGILATLNRVELLLSQQNQPGPSGLSEDSAPDSGDGERRSDREEDKNEGQSGNGEEGESGVDEENQEDGNEVDDANQTDENEAKNENQQQNDNEAEGWTSCGRRGDVESVAGPAMSNIANMSEFGEVIGFGNRLPHNPGFPLLFSQAFLEKFEADESLWSIPGVNEKYPGIMIPGAFAAIIGFITYFIVFNLNLLILGLRRLFSVPRSILLTRMANEKDDSKDDSEDSSEDDSQGDPESSSVNNSTGVHSSVNNSTNEGSSLNNSMTVHSSVNNSMSEGRPANNSMNEGISVNNSTREGRSVKNSMRERRSVNNPMREGSSANNSLNVNVNEGSSVNNSKSDGSGNKIQIVINDKLSTHWLGRAQAFEVFPRQYEGPRSSN
ncbi:hypothetical protein VF21_03159 [Pseudogymnoascus sp. 05NY08]|nr:hypothetical protein VF21_03159 [Pseudogymnoascus sp. 05NY08]